MASFVADDWKKWDPLELTPELERVAREEYGETPERRREVLDELRKKIQELPDEKDRLEDLSDGNLIRFLRNRKFDVDRALKTTVALQKFKRDHPDWFNASDEEIRHFAGMARIMDKRDPQGRIVVMLRFAKVIKLFTDDFIKKNPAALIRMNIFVFEQISRIATIQILGFVIIPNFQGFSFWDNLTLVRIAPVSERIAAFYFLSHCVGLRLKGAFILNEPAHITLIFSLLRMGLSEKLRGRFHLCGSNYKPLHEFIGDLSVLPESIGGTAPDGDGPIDWISMLVELSHRSNPTF